MSRIICNLDGEGFPVPVTEHDDGRVSFTADADIDADGAPHAYGPSPHLGLDDIRNAKDRAGNFVGVLTDRHGEPLIQGSDDPAPGFYISTTSYELSDHPATSQRRYLDSERVPFIVVSPLIRRGVKGIVLGCKARVTWRGHSISAIVGDIGPTRKAGELSIAAALALGIPPSPRSGGIDEPEVLYELWPSQQVEIDGITYPLQPA